MNLEEEFDGIIRKKANEINFPFDEKNWEKASAMLDADRKALVVANRTYYVASITGILFIVALVAGFNYSPLAIMEQQLAEKNIKLQRSTKFFDFETQGASVTIGNKIHEQNRHVQKKPWLSNEIDVEKKGRFLAFSKKEPVNQTAISAVQRPLFTHPQVNNEKTSNNDNIVSKTNPLASQQTEREIDEARILQGKKDDEFYTLYSVVAEFPQPKSQDKEIDALPFIALNCYDEDYYKKNAKRKTHYLNFELGGVYLLGWNTKNGKDGQGADLFGGFNYGVYLNKKISLSAGLQSYNIRNIHQACYTNKKTEYDFGIVTSNTVITSNNLYYVAVPFKVNYALNSGNQISLGVNTGYAVRAKNTVETYKVQEDNIQSNVTTTKNTALYQNINSLNMMLTLSYKTEIVPRLFLNGEFIYGVTDIFKNNKNIKNHEEPIGFRIGFQYNLFDK